VYGSQKSSPLMLIIWQRKTINGAMYSQLQNSYRLLSYSAFFSSFHCHLSLKSCSNTSKSSGAQCAVPENSCVCRRGLKWEVYIIVRFWFRISNILTPATAPATATAASTTTITTTTMIIIINIRLYQ
jgi:hypothetical protein